LQRFARPAIHLPLEWLGDSSRPLQDSDLVLLLDQSKSGSERLLKKLLGLLRRLLEGFLEVEQQGLVEQ
jgi:hypothetical protein